MEPRVETTLGEQLLLSLDDESGVEKEPARFTWVISAASLVELALAGRVDVSDDNVTVLDPTPLGDPTLDAALGDIVGWDKPGRTKDWIHHLRKGAVRGPGRLRWTGAGAAASTT